MHTTSPDLFKQVSLSYSLCSLYRCVQMYSLYFMARLQMEETSIMQLWISLCVSFLIPNCFSPPPHSTREDDREKSWAKRSPFEPFLAMILQTLCGGSESGRAVWNPAPVSRGNARPEGLCVSKVCQGGQASRFSKALYKHWRLSSTGWISHTPDVKL